MGSATIHRRPARRAFTLAELLIVIAILGVLAALLIPGLWRAWDSVATHQCKRNLAHLYQALQIRRAESAESPLPDVKPRAWPSQLIGYLEWDPACLVCPSSTAEASFVEEDDRLPPSEPGSEDERTWSHRYTPEPEAPQNYSQLSELIELALGGNRYVPLEEGPWVVKLSDTQVQAAQARGYLLGDGKRDLRGAMDTTYQPDSNSNVYWLCSEDVRPSGGDRDFNDTMIRVHDNGDGSYDLTLSGHTGGAHTLVTRPDHQLVYALPRGSFYHDVQITVGTEEVEKNPEGIWQPETNPYTRRGPDGKPGRMVIVTNYGMPGESKFLTYRPGAIALLDYGRYVAHGDDCWTDPEVDPNGDGVPAFARHEGRINVLRVDGSVRLVGPEEVNPAYPSVYRKYWLP
jgi:prepilin-type N-terminal cleavage/methylation domain-containing protein/prepilin-type processing-associated H-X9-DG protein